MVIFNPVFILTEGVNAKTAIINKIYGIILSLYSNDLICELVALTIEMFLKCVGIYGLVIVINGMVGWATNKIIIKMINLRIGEVLMMDIILGFTMETYAIKHLELLKKYVSTISLIYLVYLGFFLIGSFMYWDAVFSIKGRVKKYFLKKNDGDYDRIWGCISNAKYSKSILCRFVLESQWQDVMLDKIDKKNKKYFLKNFLIIIDKKSEIDKEFKKQIYQILKIPHARIGILILNQNSNSKNNLFNNINIRVKMIAEPDMMTLIRMDKLIQEVKIKSKNLMRLPTQFIKNDVILKKYFIDTDEEDIRLKLLKKILTELSGAQAIYALFDFIDLNYRILISYYKHIDYKWMEEKGVVIGRLQIMENILGSYLNERRKEIKLTVQDIFENIITKSEITIIKKYIQNYKCDFKYDFVETINYLTRRLRNILRGHGNFEIIDLNILYELVFKLAVINMYILQTDNIHILISNEIMENSRYRKVIGKKEKGEKELSPFIIGTSNGDLLVYNNWNRKLKYPVEYINYMNGEIKNVETIEQLQK